LISWISNEEELMQFGGPSFRFPLTPEQLDISLADTNRIAFRIVRIDTNRSIGHAEIYLLDDAARLGRIIIGDTSQRGKGIGQQVMHLLLEYTFNQLGKTKAELNVFDWNIAAIKCYEKVGFIKDDSKRLERTVNGKTWTAFNMWIDKKIYYEARFKG
jgi:RimJ/RimL family protein N-acetyltransferase